MAEAQIRRIGRWGPQAWYATVTASGMDIGYTFGWTERAVTRKAWRIINRHERELAWIAAEKVITT